MKYILPIVGLAAEMHFIPLSFWQSREFGFMFSAAMPIALPWVVLHVYLDKGLSGRGWGFIR